MKLTVFGFSQKKAMEYELDCTDLCIIDYLLYIQASDRIEKSFINGKVYFQLNHEITEMDVPILDLKERGFSSRLAVLIEKGFVEKIVRCDIGSKIKKVFYKVTELAISMRHDNEMFVSEKAINSKPIVEESEENENITKRFIKPTVEEVEKYCKERKNCVNAQAFVDFYESKGWFIGKNKMKDWKSAVRTWENKERQNKKGREIEECTLFDNDVF